MKIPGSDSSDAVKRKLSTEQAVDAQAQKLKKDSEKARADGHIKEQDTVKVNLGRYISQELNPQKLEATSQERVAQLKALIDSGQYHASSEAVAKSFLDYVEHEVDFEKSRERESKIEEI